LNNLKNILKDPPPEFAFEVTSEGIAMSRTRPPAATQRVPLPPGVLVPSPVKDNVTDADELAAAVKALVPAAAGRGRRGAALILPDNSMRVAVIDFETLPEKEDERLTLIKFRLRKTLPFDVDEAALSTWIQPGTKKVVAAVVPIEIIARYEAPFRAAGLQPGLVTCSALALLELLPRKGALLVAHLSPGSLTVLALRDGVLTLARSLELTANTSDPLDEISADLYPTLIYLEDQAGFRPEKLVIAGFGSEGGTAATRLSVELDIPVEALNVENPGLAGYLKSAGETPLFPINLAREPFRRDRPILVASAAVGVLMAFSLIFLVWLAVSAHGAAIQTQQQLDAARLNLTKIRREQARLDGQMRRPEYAVVFDRNIMINELIRRKAISWTRIFADLSTVLPETVRITAIRPQVNAQDHLSLDMTVEADAAPQIISFVSKLEGSSVFGATEVSTITPPNQNDPYVHYRISVNYAQKL
jgi:Tfp pilus assembly protein PilN